MKDSGSFKALTYLSLFGLAITVPLLLLVAALIFQSAFAQRGQLEARVSQVLLALTNDLDRDLDRHITILHTLAASQSLASADWPTFYKQAKAALQGRTYLVLVDSTGRQLVNTYVRYGAQPAMTGDPETVRRILQTKAPAVSNLFESLVVKKPVVNVSIPILEDGQVRYVMSLGLLPDDLLALLKAQNLGSRWVTLIWDANGVILARSRNSERYVGKPLPKDLREHDQPAVVRTNSLDGLEVLYATARSRVSGWGVGVNVPYSLVTRPVRNSLLLWVAVALIAITVALVSGVFFARKITTPLSVAADAADAFGRGRTFPLAGSRLKEADAFLVALKNAQQAREKLTDEVKQGRDWLQTTLTSIGDGVIATDAEGKVSLLNAVAQTLTGWTQEEAAGKPLEQVFVIRNAESGQEVENPVAKVLREGRTVGLANHTRLLAKDGGKIPIDDSAAPIYDAAGKIAGVVMVFRDISERLKTEERMRLAVDAAPNAMIMVGRDGRMELVNSQTEKLFGYERDELLGQSIEILVPERYRTGHDALRTAFLSEPSARPMGAGRDLYGLRKDGLEVPIEIGLNPITTSQGNFVIAAIIDISERKRAEALIRAANEELRRTAHLLEPVACFVRNIEDTRIIYWNPGAADLYGFSSEEALVTSSHVLLQTEFPAALDQIMAQLMTTGIWDGELTHKRRDGKRITVTSHWTLHKDEHGQPLAILEVNIDISERKHVEERLKESQAQFKRLIDSNIVGIVIANEKRVVEANDVYLGMLGCSREDLLAGRADWAKATPADSYEKDLHAICELREHGFCAPYEKEYIRPDGSRCPILIGVAALSGYVELTWICVVLDMSEQKRLQNALISTNKQLMRANEDLEQFAYSASHDLQEPLRMIASYSQLLVKGYRGQLDGEAGTCIQFITDGTKRMRELLADLLAYTQLTGEGQEHVAPVELNEAFQTARENCKAAIQEAGAIVSSDPLPAVLGYKPHFVQLFQNLISNGLKYRSDQPPRVHVSAERQTGFRRIAVKDNGIGIAPEYQKQIFGVFKRLHGKNIPGTGIGLAICQRVVDRYGGQIWVESQVGQGSTFCFTLPAAEEGAAAHDG